MLAIMGKSMKESLMALPEWEREAIIAVLDPDIVIQMARNEWWFTSRPEQVPPQGNWTIHLYLGGRGTGKTKSGAEWLVERALKYPISASGFPTERMVMAYNLSDTREVCIEGDSGIIRVLERKGMEANKDYRYVRSPKPSIVLTETGTKIRFTGASPNAARGPNLADVWMDEIVKWDNPDLVWKEGIYPALRADVPGDKPRAFVTTTPKPIPILQSWVGRDDGFVSMSRGSTFDNALNLDASFLEEIRREYEGTALGRQELYGELLDQMDGPLFSYSCIENNRLELGPTEVEHRVVGVDPCLTGGEDGDWMGVVVASRDNRDHMYVVADESVRLTGSEAARHVWHVFARYQADALVVEDNLGKQWLVKVLTDTYDEMTKEGFFPKFTTAPLKTIHSNHGKKLRAEPVSLRYQQGRVHHLGRFEKLEAEMVSWDPVSSKVSPDRLDALVHACRHLMDGERKTVRVFNPARILVPGL
jgi:phage terminase large subunit-like protein